MPGAKRRLKKAAAAAANAMSGSGSESTPNGTGNGSVDALSSSAIQSGSTLGDSPSDHHHHLHVPSFLHHHHKSPSPPPPHSGTGSAGGMNMTSTTSLGQTSSIASDPANYLSDEALAEDLEVEQEMDERQQSIGSGHHRIDDGVGDLSKGMNGMKPPSREQFKGESLLGDVDEDERSINSSNTMSSAATGPKMGAGNATVPAPGGAMRFTADQLVAGPPQGGKKKKSSKQRFAERQARKRNALLDSQPPDDPNWTAQLERERQEEIQVISEACEVLGREIFEIAPDGHCMFNAIADQLHCLGIVGHHEPKWMRRQTAEYMLAHPDDFMPFLPSITGEDSNDATSHDGMMTTKEFKKYCDLVAETGEWGGEPEIQALSRKFKIPIHVIQRGPPTIVSHGGLDDDFGGVLTAEKSAAVGDRVVRISYHKRMYGLGEHYNSLRKVAA